VVMEGGSGGESSPAAHAPASVAKSKTKSLAGIEIEIWVMQESVVGVTGRSFYRS
jgi:hypothetical protein